MVVVTSKLTCTVGNHRYKFQEIGRDRNRSVRPAQSESDSLIDKVSGLYVKHLFRDTLNYHNNYRNTFGWLVGLNYITCV